MLSELCFVAAVVGQQVDVVVECLLDWLPETKAELVAEEIFLCELKETVTLSDGSTPEQVGVVFASEIAEVGFGDVVTAVAVLGSVAVAVGVLVEYEIAE